MGCWEETCAISHLPILENEECYMVLFRPDVLNIGCFMSLSFADRYVKKIYFGKYDDYGWLQEIEKPYDEVYKHVIFIKKNLWDYAQTKDYDFSTLKNGWDAEVEMQRLCKEEIKPYDERLIELCHVFSLCWELRIDPFGSTGFKGCQSYQYEDKYEDFFNVVLEELKEGEKQCQV